MTHPFFALDEFEGWFLSPATKKRIQPKDIHHESGLKYSKKCKFECKQLTFSAVSCFPPVEAII